MRSLLTVLFLSLSALVSAQSDTLFKTGPKSLYRPHIVKFNPTPSLVWNSQSLMFGYEQVVKPYQSFSISAGILSIPGAIREREVDTASFQFARSKSIGYSVVVDYRFYYKKGNKFNAPHGLYFAPYVAHHNHFWESNAEFVLASGDFLSADISTHLMTFGIGGQIGYQFSFFEDKFTVDLITFAPSYSFYKFTLKADSEANFEFEDYYPELAELLLDRYPWLSALSKEKLVEFKGSTNTTSIGARFVIQLGYRF